MNESVLVLVRSSSVCPASRSHTRTRRGMERVRHCVDKNSEAQNKTGEERDRSERTCTGRGHAHARLSVTPDHRIQQIAKTCLRLGTATRRR
jgi:hypothetical protein